jgi:Meiotically Up-regulated Gene 113 (MUG113) protein
MTDALEGSQEPKVRNALTVATLLPSERTLFAIMAHTMPTKEEIIREIKRTAQENGGAPLGAARFHKETAISSYEWGKHWARFGDALIAAGFPRNQFVTAYPDEFMAEKIVGLARKNGKFPTFRDFLVGKQHDRTLPGKNSFQRFGSKREIAQKVASYCKAHPGYDDVLALCEPILATPQPKEIDDNTADVIGEVYLIKSGRYYKIGKTIDPVRRGAELRLQLPEKITLIHSIRTDDPYGVEAYWHKRFESKCKNSEWFDLTSRDLKTFKRWKRIY